MMPERARVIKILVAASILTSCTPQITTPVELAVFVNRDACFRAVREQPEVVLAGGRSEAESPCDAVLAELDRLLDINPNDAWARTERAEVHHVLARERGRYSRSLADAASYGDFTAQRDSWLEFLNEWNSVYSDLVYFRLPRADQPATSRILASMQRRLLADFLILNAQYAERLDEACDGFTCDRDLLSLISGTLYHIAAAVMAEEIGGLATDAGTADGANLVLMREELCATWFVGVQGYFAFRNRGPLGVDYGPDPCLPLRDEELIGVPEEVRVLWRIRTLDGFSYGALADYFLGVRADLYASFADSGAETFEPTEEQLRSLLILDMNGVAAQVVADLLMNCASGNCEGFPDRATSPQGAVKVWHELFQQDMSDLRRLVAELP